MRLTHTKAIVFSGITWLIIGMFLIFKGLFYTVQTGPRYVQILVIIAAFLIGLLKAWKILSKTVEKVVKGVITQPSPLKIRDIYTSGYCMVILSMMCLGFLIRFLPIPNLVRGFVDTAVGTALITGAILYFCLAASLKKEK